MRIWQALLLIPVALSAQQPQPSALVEGVLLERDTQGPTGEFSVRGPENQVFRYRFDEKTRVERDQLVSSLARLEPGDTIAVASDNGPGSSLRYARTVQVLAVPAPAHAVAELRSRAYRAAPSERPVSNGSLTFSGVVFRISPERLVLHTRASGDQTILLRKDTRYLDNGAIVEPGELQTNMRVFIRAGHTLFNEVEAYQVVWGQILEPREAGR